MSRPRPTPSGACAVLIGLAFLAFGLTAHAQNYTHYDLVIPTTATTVKTTIDGAGRVMPPDRSFVIGLEGGTRGPIMFTNWTAANPLYPIIVVNKHGTGRVVVSDLGAASPMTGIAIENCSFFKLLGNNDPAYYYGIEIARAGGSQRGISAGDTSTNLEIAFTEVHNVGFAGIMAKTDPVEAKPWTWAANFTMHDVNIHDNYIHDTGGEGMYIGYTGWSTDHFASVPGYESHEIKGLKVSYNLIERTGWDGFQYSSAPDDPSATDDDAEVFNNIIHSPALLNDPNQRAGFVIGGGSGGKVYNNVIIGGTGPAFSLFGRGYNTLYNNLVVAGVGNSVLGIFTDNRGTEDPRRTVPGSFQSVYNNTFIVPEGPVGPNGEPAVNHAYWTMNEVTVNNFKNNVSLVYNLSSSDVFADGGSTVNTGGNLLLRSTAGAGFVNPAENDYRIQTPSTAADIGVNLGSLPSGEVSVIDDFQGLNRPQAGAYDAGFSESGALSVYLVCTPPTIGNTGSIKASVIGGTAPYTYLWSTSATTQTVSNLPAGLYSVTVTDSLGAKMTRTTYLADGAAMGAPVRVTPPNEVLAPGFSPAPGTFTNSQSVTLSSTTSGATIRYTTDGSTPSATVGAIYSGPISVNNSTVITAIATKSGMTPSVVSKGTYVINNGPANTKFTIVDANITESGHISSNVKARAVDGSLTTYWRDDGDGKWIQFDLGSNQRVGLLKMAFDAGHQANYTFDVLASTDGTNWTNLLTGWQSNRMLGLQEFDLPDFEPARYVRIVGHQNNNGNVNLQPRNSYAEVEIWGGPTGSMIAPTVVTQPQSQTVAVGENATFVVSAAGTPAPAYQWKKDGVDITGATASTFTVYDAQSGDAGNYTVVVTNLAGSVTSNAAALGVGSGPLGLQLQGENATLYGAVVASSQAGYTGTGYADYIHSSGDYVEWTFSNPSAATRTLTFRYATAGTTRTLGLTVNGVGAGNVTFNSTTGSNWALATTTASMPAGTVTVRLTATGQNGPNTDYLQID